jgi:hypothetical protein
VHPPWKNRNNPKQKFLSHLLHPNPDLACRPHSSEELPTLYNPRRTSMHTSRFTRPAAALGAVSAVAFLSACGSMGSTAPCDVQSVEPAAHAVQVPAGNKVAMETVGVGDSHLRMPRQGQCARP